MLRDLAVDFAFPDSPLRQVIVNTHSTVFVKEIYNMMPDKCITIAYAEMVNRVITLEGVRKKILVTKITPLEQEDALQTSIQFSGQERKLTLHSLMEYMRMNDNESIMVGEKA